MNTILEYLANNKAIVTGAVATLSESFVIIWNMVRRLKTVDKQDVVMNDKWYFLKIFVWSCNPINIFRKS